MQLMVVVLNKIACMPAILSGFMEQGIGGTTIVDCEGALRVIGQSSVEPPPIFGALRQFLNPERAAGKLLLTVLDESNLERAKKIVDNAVGGIGNPDTGIIFTIALTGVEGLAKYNK